MTCRLLLVGMVIGASALSAGSIRAAACDPEGNVNFICGVGSPEDLLAIPRSDWVLASGYVAGGLHLISTRDFTTITGVSNRQSPVAAGHHDLRVVPWADRSCREGGPQRARSQPASRIR